MSTEMRDANRFSLTRFYGGSERGLFLQITPPSVGPSPTRDEGFITVTEEEARDLGIALLEFAGGTLKEYSE